MSDHSGLSFPEAARLCRCHLATLHRWRLHGIQGIKLETYRVGGRRYVTPEAIDRFNAAITASVDGDTVSTSQRESDSARAKRLDRIDAELAAAGI